MSADRSRFAPGVPTCTGLTIGAAGAVLVWWAGFPAPWLSGSMLAVATASAMGVRVGLAAPVRSAAFVALGFSMGATLSPETVATLALWPLGLLFLGASIATITVFVAFYLQRVHRWDRVTAFFSSVPGSFTLLMVVAARSRADMTRVGVTQLLRVLVLTVALPPLLMAGDPQTVMTSVPVVGTAGVPETAFWLALAMAAGLVAERLQVPAGMLLGAMLVSALGHAGGFTVSRLPEVLVMSAFVATGVFVGSRVSLLSLAQIRVAIGAGLAGVAIALLVSGAFALLASVLLELPLALLWLAYAPGGLDVMAILALALGIDPAFVIAHHLLRFLALSLLLPVVLSRLRMKEQG